MLRQLPNCVTILRLLMTIPLGMLILHEQFGWALAVGLISGASDGLDGFLARRLNAHSRLGAILDPIADKVLVTGTFLCAASIQLIPWYLAAVVIARDLIIIVGVGFHHWLVGPVDFSPTLLSKINMLVQISFCILILVAQIIQAIPASIISLGQVLVIFFAVSSGADYARIWLKNALQKYRQR